jgi:hypothetical protein
MTTVLLGGLFELQGGQFLFPLVYILNAFLPLEGLAKWGVSLSYTTHRRGGPTLGRVLDRNNR